MEKKKIMGAILGVILLPNIVYGIEKEYSYEKNGFLYEAFGSDLFTRGYKDYYLKVKNKDGAKIYLENNKDSVKYDLTKEVIPYGTVVKYTYDACKHGSCKLHNSNFKEEDYYVLVRELGNDPGRLGGIVNIRDFEVEKTNYREDPRLLKSGLYSTKDIKVRKGPGVIYDIAGTIKRDTNLLVDEKLMDMSHIVLMADSPTGDWIMVSDGKTKGYVDFPLDTFRNDDIAYKYGQDKDYYYDPNDENRWIKPIEEIQFGNKIDVKYIYRDRVYIKYEKQYRKVGIENVMNKTGLELYIPKNYDPKINTDIEEMLINKKDNSEVNMLELLEKGKSYKGNYIMEERGTYGMSFYLMHDNKQYMLKPENIYGEPENAKRYTPIITDGYKDYKFDKDIALLDLSENDISKDIYGKQKIIKTLKKGETIKAYKVYNYCTGMEHGVDEEICNNYLNLYNEEMGYFSIKEKNKKEETKPIKIKKDYTLTILGFTTILILIATITIKIITKHYN